MTGGYALLVRFTAKNEAAAAAFDELVQRTLQGIRQEPGTLVYAVHTPEDQPLQRVFYELYASREAFRTHEEQPHTVRMLQERDQYLVRTEVEFLNEQAGKRPMTEET